MKYPNGETIRVGDLVWWNEGTAVGYVQSVAETPAEFQSLGLDSPHLFIANRHPYDSSESLGVAHDEACLEEEGIGPLDQAERERLDRATHAAFAIWNLTPLSQPFSIHLECTDHRPTEWIFDLAAPAPKRKPARIRWTR